MKKVLYLLLGICLFSISNVYAEEIVENLNVEIVTLEECIDGDTAKFKISDDTIIKARFLAVDTPETVHPTKGVELFGKEASEFTCTSLKEAKEIKIEYDENSDEEDNYGRKLVWVFVDGVLLQNSLVSKGYAEVAYLYDDYKYTPLLQDTEVIAKLEGVGIWSSEEETTSKIDTTIETTEDTEKENKNFINKLIDELIATVIEIINEILESILNLIEDML